MPIRGSKVRVWIAVSAFSVVLLIVAAGCATLVDAVDVGRRGTVVRRVAVADDPQEVADLVPIFADSSLRYDDKIGFEECYVVTGEDEVLAVMGTIRRQFYRPEEGRSPLEIMLFYQEALEELGGTILYRTRDAQSVEIEGVSLVSYFREQRIDRGLSTYVADHSQFPGAMSEYLAAVVPMGDSEAYVVVAAGRRHRETPEFRGARFEIVTVDI